MPAVIKSIEEVEVTVDATLEPVTTNLTKNQDETQCVPFVSSHAAGALTDQHQDREVEVTFIDNSGTPAVVCTASARADNDDSMVTIHVVEFAKTVNVQQRALDMTGTSATDSSVTDVGNLNQAFVIYSHQFTSPPTSDDDFNDICVAVDFDSTTSITISRAASGGTVEGTLYIVDCDNSEWTVHHHADSFGPSANASLLSTIDGSPTVVLADCFTIFSYDTDNGDDDIVDNVWSGHLDSTTQVEFNRTQGNTPASTSCEFRLQIVECNNNEWTCYRNTAFETQDGATTKNVNIGGTVDTFRTIAKWCNGIEGSTCRLATTGSTSGNDIDDGMLAIRIQSATQWQLERYGTSWTAGRLYWEVIEFKLALNWPQVLSPAQYTVVR